MVWLVSRGQTTFSSFTFGWEKRSGIVFPTKCKKGGLATRDYGMVIKLLDGTTETQLSILKPCIAQWMIDLYTYFTSYPSIIINGFHAAGIKDW